MSSDHENSEHLAKVDDWPMHLGAVAKEFYTDADPFRFELTVEASSTDGSSIGLRVYMLDAWKKASAPGASDSVKKALNPIIFATLPVAQMQQLFSLLGRYRDALASLTSDWAEFTTLSDMSVPLQVGVGEKKKDKKTEGPTVAALGSSAAVASRYRPNG